MPVYSVSVAVQLSAKSASDIPHTGNLVNGFPKLRDIVKLFVNRKVVKEKFHLFAPTCKVVHVLVELIEKTFRPNIYATGTV